MGCVCSCFGFGNSEDNQNRSICSPRAFISYFLNKYPQILGTGQARPIGCVGSAPAPCTSNAGLEGGLIHPRCTSNLQVGEGEQTTSHEKGPDCHLLKDPDPAPEPLGGSNNIIQAGLHELVSGEGRHINRSFCELSTAHEVASRVDYISTSQLDEDVCPTCLEEYAPENPRIVTQCSHHFHLGCIYEWLERSETCPVCCKLMVFDQTS